MATKHKMFLKGTQELNAVFVDEHLKLLDALIEAYKLENVQKQLRKFIEEGKQGKMADEVANRREAFLLDVQMPIVARFGYEASMKGVQDAMITFSHAEMLKLTEVQKRNPHLETLLMAGAPLACYGSIAEIVGLRDQGQLRPLPEDRFPIVVISQDKLVDNCIIEQRPRQGILSKDDTDLLEAACRDGDTTRAKQLLGVRKIGPSTKALLINVGYRNFGLAATKVLAKCFSPDLESLELDISGNNIGAEGVAVLAAGLPKKLRVLKLNFSNNRITKEGVIALSKDLPSELEVLHLGLASVRMGPEGAAALSKGFPPGLIDLSLDLYGNNITDEGVGAISRALPRSLQELNLVLLKNQISRKGLFCIDRQINNPYSEHPLPELEADRFKKAAELELFEFREEEDGSLIRELDWRSNF